MVEKVKYFSIPKTLLEKCETISCNISAGNYAIKYYILNPIFGTWGVRAHLKSHFWYLGGTSTLEIPFLVLGGYEHTFDTIYIKSHFWSYFVKMCQNPQVLYYCYGLYLME